MKKLVFAAIAAMVMVSVSNVFANNNKVASVTAATPVDTVAPAQPADTTVKEQTPAETPAQPTATPADTTNTTESATSTTTNSVVAE